jgi:uncharacterized protein (TIGR00106 family)
MILLIIKKDKYMLSVLLEFSMFPTSSDGREGSASVSKQVSKVIDAIDKSGISYQLTPMGTIIEASSMKEALGIIELAYEELSDCERVYSSLKFDIRKNTQNRLKTKIESVENVLNRKINH